MHNTNTKEKLAKVISILGAFNYNVGLSLDMEKLIDIYSKLIKRFSLVAETAKTGSGNLLLNTINKASFKEVTNKTFEYDIESIVVYGETYDKLQQNARKHVKDLQILDESAHFSRIMDVDDVGDKKLVGIPDAGNQRMVRMLMNVVRYREDLKLKSYWPLPNKILIDTAADFSVPNSPVLNRNSYPYLGAVIFADNPKTANDLMHIFHRLICSYSLEVTLVLLEEWLMNNEIQDKNISLNIVQVLNQNNTYKIKFASVGGGTFIISSNKKSKIYFLNKENNAKHVGQIDYQVKHTILEIDIDSYSQILIFPNIINLPKDFKSDFLCQIQKSKIQKILKSYSNSKLFNVSSLIINPKKFIPFHLFSWNDDNIDIQLSDLYSKIQMIHPSFVNIQYGHIHSDRKPSNDQKVGSMIAGRIAQKLKQSGTRIISMPMIDNYHVPDRINIQQWLNFLEKYSLIKTDEPNFESALITRHLANEVLYFLQKNISLKINNIGGNIYFNAGPHCRIELYDGVGKDYNLPGRMGCVPFEMGLEIYRLNSNLASNLYKKYILYNFPKSLVAKWWLKDPDFSYQQLIYKHVYSLQPKDRILLKKQKDLEIDISYKDKVMNNNTNIVETIFKNTDISKIILIHVMESFYNAQHAKFSTLWNACNLPQINLWRVGFNRYNGNIEVLDTNINKDAYQKIVGQQNR